MFEKQIVRRLDPLTSLRFFAAAMIVMYHAGGRGLGPAWPLSFSLGQGVSFFFVLSGFVLAYNHASLNGWVEIRNFYIARVARIWPSHIATAFLYILLIGNISYFTLPEQSRLWITLAYVTLVHAWVPVSEFISAYNTVSWSISTEFFFYLAFPLLVWNWPRNWKTKIAVTFLLACLMLWLADTHAIAANGTEDGRGNLGYINPLARVFEFTLGIATCHLYSKYGATARSFWKLGVATGIEVAALLLALISLWLSHWLASSPGIVAEFGKTGAMVLNTTGFGTLFFAGVIFVFAIGAGRVSALLSTRPLVFLGEISFGLYLVHTLFLLYRQQAPGVFDGLPDAAVFMLYWGVGLTLATMVHFGVERPCQFLIRGLASSRPVNGGGGRSFAALAGFAVAVLCVVLFQPTTRTAYIEAPAATNLLKDPVRFGGGYRLTSIELIPGAARFSWQADEHVSLAKRVAVHLLDAHGNMVGQLDFALETGFRSADRGEAWSNIVAFNRTDTSVVKLFGVAIYDNHGMSSILPGGQFVADWNDQRLLVPTARGGMDFVAKVAGRSGFTSSIQPSELEGEWLAGEGVARVTLASNSKISLITEAGLPGEGVVDGDRIRVAGWGVEARLTADKEQLRWSNGFIWRRGIKAN